MLKAEFDERLSKVNELYKVRLKYALQIMRKDTIEVLMQVPLLLHYNHPLLPGYRDDGVPCGIDLFEPDETQIEFLASRNIDYKKNAPKETSIYALYCMGSTSSIAQGQKSDLDIWVCISKDMSFHNMNLLSEKCRFISSYAKAKGVEINLFVTAENRFTSGEHGQMDTEDCGSAQNLFLLDEFYRSSVKLCGRNIAWYMISVEEEQENYQKYLNAFYECDCVKKREWFDFGSVAKCSPVEYFGSGLWLVYKGIDHPFKAVLKILLMEAYSSEYPKTKLLSLEIKRATYNTGLFSLSKDAYYQMYRKVESYLKKKGDTDRLILARICFYLKVKGSIDNIPPCTIKDLRSRFLRRMAIKWGLDRSSIEDLNNAAYWKIDKATKVNNQLLSSLLASYQALLRFCVEYGIEYAITSDDAGVLSRKIYAAIDRYPGKILLTSKDHSFVEDTLSFISPSKGSVCRNGVHCYTSSLTDISLLSCRAIYIAKTLAEAVCFTTLNHVLHPTTKVELLGCGNAATPAKIATLSAQIYGFFGHHRQKVTEGDLQKPRAVIKSMLIVNFERDITRDLLISQSDLEIGNSLSCGRQKMCLISSIDVITLNSWGEINCLNFQDGEDGLVDVLASIVRNISSVKLGQWDDLSDIIKICSYSHQHSDYIRFDLDVLLRSVFGCLNHYETNTVFSIGNNSYEARSDEENNISIIKRSRFVNEELTVLSRFGMRPEYALQVPSSVERNATVGVIQYFFERKKNSWDIYIVNERNEVKIYSGFSGSRSALVNSINRLYTTSFEHSSSNSLYFNLPQYFVLSRDGATVHPFTIKQERY